MREGAEREKKRRERDSPFLPPHIHPSLPHSGPLCCHPSLSNPPPPFLWPPQMKIPGLRPKYRNSKSIQNNTQIHTLGPPSRKLPPLAGPITHLVSFKPKPHKPPPPFPFTPHLSILTFPHLFLFFHEAAKAFALVQSEMQDIYSRQRELHGMWTKIRVEERERVKVCVCVCVCVCRPFGKFVISCRRIKSWCLKDKCYFWAAHQLDCSVRAWLTAECVWNCSHCCVAKRDLRCCLTYIRSSGLTQRSSTSRSPLHASPESKSRLVKPRPDVGA